MSLITKPILLPPARLGVFGSGQLGRMFAFAARRMGYRVYTYSPEANSPTGQVADGESVGDYTDDDAVRRFVQTVDAVTFEFENVPASIAAIAQECGVPVRPGGHVLHVAQNRLREKTFLRKSGLPVTPFGQVNTLDELHQAVENIGTPAILKTAAFGYDGKGQVLIRSGDEAESAWQTIGVQPAILEAYVDFVAEVSLMAVRSNIGEYRDYGVIENQHARHILDWSLAPARVPPATVGEASQIARAVLEQLDVVGVLCIEFFLHKHGHLLINELAPRPHNSGHLTIEAALTSQFEQQVRALCGLPLGACELVRPAAMVNLIGDLWQGGSPNWAAACAIPGCSLHLYGKAAPRSGRKMGHLTVLAPDAESALTNALRARQMATEGRYTVSEEYVNNL
jgi:5-(carboxyamino)imidazole ribonucleotide synthase